MEGKKKVVYELGRFQVVEVYVPDRRKEFAAYRSNRGWKVSAGEMNNLYPDECKMSYDILSAMANYPTHKIVKGYRVENIKNAKLSLLDWSDTFEHAVKAVKSEVAVICVIELGQRIRRKEL